MVETLARDYKKIRLLSAFGELKTAEYTIQAQWKFPYNINTDMVKPSGDVVHSGAFAVLTAAAGLSASIETRAACRYQPGVGGLVMFTAIFDDGKPETSQAVGLGSSLDGLAFGYIGEEFGAIIRSKGVTTFTPISEFTHHSNIPQGFDPSFLNVYSIQYQWLGAGEIRFYIEDPKLGGFVLVHEVRYAGKYKDVSIDNPSLPLAASCRSWGSNSVTLKTPSGSAGIEGRQDGETTSTPYGAEAIKTVTARVPVISGLNQETYLTKPNSIRVRPLLISWATDGNKSVTFKLIANPTLTGSNFQSQGDNTPVLVDTASTAISGGRVLTSWVGAKVDSGIFPAKDLPLFLTPGETFSITAESASASEVTISVSYVNLF